MKATTGGAHMNQLEAARQSQTERLFVALPLPEDVKVKLTGLQADFPGLKWATPVTMHLTLRFIGQIPQERIDVIRRSLRDVRADAFCLTVTGLRLFQQRGGGILWAGLQEEPALCELKRRVDDSLHSGAGLDLEDGSFSPHLTLSRLRKPASLELKNLVQTKAAERFGEFPVTAFTLFRSFLRPTGAIHEPVETYPLAGEH
jgi:2'-5' RNA ligase